MTPENRYCNRDPNRTNPLTVVVVCLLLAAVAVFIVDDYLSEPETAARYVMGDRHPVVSQTLPTSGGS